MATESSQSKRYLAWFKKHFSLSRGLGFHDVSAKTDFLTFQDVLGCNLTGTTDVVISFLHDSEGVLRQNIMVVMDVKKVGGANTAKCDRQIIMESVAALAHSNIPTLFVLTDLNECWLFLRFTGVENGKIIANERLFKNPRSGLDFLRAAVANLREYEREKNNQREDHVFFPERVSRSATLDILLGDPNEEMDDGGAADLRDVMTKDEQRLYLVRQLLGNTLPDLRPALARAQARDESRRYEAEAEVGGLEMGALTVASSTDSNSSPPRVSLESTTSSTSPNLDKPSAPVKVQKKKRRRE